MIITWCDAGDETGSQWRPIQWPHQGDQEVFYGNKMSFKDEKPLHSPKLNAAVWGNDPKTLCYRTAKGNAHIFYARIQKETEEFLYHLLKQNDSFQQGIVKEEPQNSCAVEDASLTKLKYLVMIHTACSQITNLLVNPP